MSLSVVLGLSLSLALALSLVSRLSPSVASRLCLSLSTRLSLSFAAQVRALQQSGVRTIIGSTAYADLDEPADLITVRCGIEREERTTGGAAGGKCSEQRGDMSVLWYGKDKSG